MKKNAYITSARTQSYGADRKDGMGGVFFTEILQQ